MELHNVVPVPELNQQSTIKIIDNLGIHKGSAVVDVIANPTNIRSHILGQVLKRSPRFMADAEKLVNGLTISFGARPLSEIEKEVAIQRQKDDAFDIDTLQLFWQSLNPTDDVKGGYFYSPIHPYLYINTGKASSSNEELRLVWDHEVSHLIDLLDPKYRDEKNILKMLGSAIAGLSIWPGAIATVTFAVDVAKKIKTNKQVSRRELFKIGAGGAVTALCAGIIASAPDVLGEEKRAGSGAINYKTDIENFPNLFIVKERSS